jgi:hypothetical protein
MKYNMGDNLIDVSCAYPKGQGHGSHICVLQNTKKFVEKDCMHILHSNLAQ